MSVKLRKVMRREVVTLAEGRRLGRLQDILIDPEHHRVAVVVLTVGSVPDTSVIVRASSVRSFESDTIAVDALDDLMIAARDEEALALLNRGLRFKGRRVVAGGGSKLGRIANVVIDERGNVTQYRIRKGPLGFVRPTLKVPPGNVRTSGGELAVLHDEPPEAGADTARTRQDAGDASTEER